MTVAFKELAGSPRKTYGPDGPKAHREILVNGSDELAMVKELLGDGYEFGGSKRLAYPNWKNVVAVHIQSEPFPPAPDPQDSFDDIATQINTYTKPTEQRFIKLTIEYELLVVEISGVSGLELPGPEPDTFLTYRMDLGGELIKVPAHNLHWRDKPNEPPPKDGVINYRVPITEHHLTWHRVINPPITAIRTCRGLTNNALFMGVQDGSMLFDGATMEREFTTFDSFESGQWAWALSYVFLERRQRWVETWRADPVDDPGWDALLDGKNRYVAGGGVDLTQLFRYEQTDG